MRKLSFSGAQVPTDHHPADGGPGRLGDAGPASPEADEEARDRPDAVVLGLLFHIANLASRATVGSMECRSITLYSNDWRACRRFYVDFLGLGVVAEGQDQFLALQGSPLCIDAAHGRPPSSGFVLFATDDLDGLRRRADAMGYQVQQEDERGLHLLDPDGREVQVYHDETGHS